MVQVVKCAKFLVKLLAIITFIITMSTYFNINLMKPRIRRFETSKVKHNLLQTYSKQNNLSLNMKYVLIYFKGGDEWKELKEEQTVFEENRCTYNNCFIVRDQKLQEDYTQIDAILINGKAIAETKNATLPRDRLPNQLFIFAMKESATNYPICDESFDNYFNLTWTYRLDSDVPWPYFKIYDNYWHEVGPKVNMNWSLSKKSVDSTKIFFEKNTAVVWFASHCITLSRRETVVNEIKFKLKEYDLELDAVGGCGPYECPIEREQECLQGLHKYYFYLAFENSFAKDYVTEKLVKAVLYNTVPVVFGGANYTRFLPPNSYIDATQLGAENTAKKIAYLIRNKTAYIEYFRWQQLYHYRADSKSVCDLCQFLNNNHQNVYKEFRKWWNPNYTTECGVTREIRSTRTENMTSGKSDCALNETPPLKSFM